MTRIVVVALVAMVLSAVVGGCSFFGGEEVDYSNWEPALSPDGRLLAYESPGEESLDLFLRSVETGEIRQLTNNAVLDLSPTWSPEGDRIAFVSSRDDNADIYVIDLLTATTERLTTHEGNDINPAWGADGRISFNSDRSERWEIYAIDPGDKSLTKITGVDTVP